MYVVTSYEPEGPCVLKDCTDFLLPVILKDPDQSVYVVNEYGLSSVDPQVEEIIFPIVLSSPELWEVQQKKNLIK